MDHPDQVHRLLIRRRVGMTLGEVLVAIAIIAILAALIVPTLTDRLERAQGDAIISEMRNLENALRMFNRDVGRYPRQLNYLTALEDLNGVRDACGTAISATNQGRYRGPYINRILQLIDPYGAPANTRYLLSTGDSVDAVLTRTTYTTVGGVTQQVLQIHVYGLDKSLLEYVEDEVDGDRDADKATVRYDEPVDPDDNVMRWTFPIRNGAC